MRKKKKYFIPFWFLLSFILHSVNAQDLEQYFKSKGVERVAWLVHPTNNFQTGNFHIYENFVLVDIKYEDYKTRLKIYKTGRFLTDIQVIEDDDRVPPFLGIALMKDIMNANYEESIGEDIIPTLEDVFNKAISDMSGSELACVILTIESLGSSFEKEEYNDKNNSQSKGFESSFIENNKPNDGFAAAFSEHERPYDEPKNRIEIDDSDGQIRLIYDDIKLLKKYTRITDTTISVGGGITMRTKAKHNLMTIQVTKENIPILNIEINENKYRGGYFIDSYQLLDKSLDKKARALEKEQPGVFYNLLKEMLTTQPIFKDKSVFDWLNLLKIEPVSAVNSQYNDYSPMVSADEEILFFLREGDPDNSMTMFTNTGNYNKPLYYNELGKEFIDQLKANKQDTRENRRNALKEQQKQHAALVRKTRKQQLELNNSINNDSLGEMPDTDILYSTKYKGEFFGIQQQDFPLNDWSSNYFIGLSADGKRIYTKRIALGDEYPINAVENPNGVYYLEYKNPAYDYEPTGNVIEFEKNHNVSSVSYILTLNNNAMICGFQGDDTHGGMDIYISFRQKNGKFGYPVNLGTTINTSGDEYNPCLAADLKTLYFIKDTGSGESIIYMSRRLDDTWEKWTTPIALPAPINMPNSTVNDVFISASGKTLYFSSNRKTGRDFDIYTVHLDDLLSATPTDIIDGKLVIKEKQLKNVQVEVQAYDKLSRETKDVSYANTNDNGDFKLLFREKEKVVIRAKKKGYISDVLIKNDSLKILPEIEMIKLDKGNRFILKNILFKADQAFFLEQSFHDLENLSDALIDNPGIKILIEGHTSFVKNNIGNLETIKKWHQDLSERRAKAVRDYLIENGIDAKRLQTKGYGGEKPIFSNENEKSRAKNRRVEIVIL
jgi:outer membrane protein OmpA-like peptidoglycan-associated protein